jgi:hypothetical protein
MGGALKTTFWDELMVVIFIVPPFLILEQCSYFIGGEYPCQELLTDFEYEIGPKELVKRARVVPHPPRGDIPE